MPPIQVSLPRHPQDGIDTKMMPKGDEYIIMPEGLEWEDEPEWDKKARAIAKAKAANWALLPVKEAVAQAISKTGSKKLPEFTGNSVTLNKSDALNDAIEHHVRIYELMTRGMTRTAATVVIDAAMYGKGCLEGQVREEIERRKS